ncbi:MAG: hypothetical protein LUH14_06410 [Clostridiaceae bacterium]|nr:hypothetical protein [Clostridiaceae bacterium]
MRERFHSYFVLKEKLIGLGVLLLIFLTGTACGAGQTDTASSVTGEAEETDDLNETIGGSLHAATELNADEVTAVTMDSSYSSQIEKILKGSDDYAKQHNEFIQQVNELCDGEEFELYGEASLYASIVPVFAWDCIENEIVVQSPKIVIFSEDLQKTGICELYKESAAYSVSSVRDMDDSVKKALTENPEQEFIFINNGEDSFLLDDKNETAAAGGSEINITGEYYQALQNAGIQISYEKLTNEENLVRIDL